jgi:hypothetical protein
MHDLAAGTFKQFLVCLDFKYGLFFYFADGQKLYAAVCAKLVLAGQSNLKDSFSLAVLTGA